MDARAELLAVCREIHARIGDNLTPPLRGDGILYQVQRLVDEAVRLSQQAGYERPPIELLSNGENVGCRLWTFGETDCGLPTRYMYGAWNDREWWSDWWPQALPVMATWVRGLEADDETDNGGKADGGELTGAETLIPSPDFASMNWRGTLYTFTTNQAACVKVLYDAWAAGTPVMGQVAITDTAGVSQTELRRVFDTHPAWGTLIVSPEKGRYRLAPPSPKENLRRGKTGA